MTLTFVDELASAIAVLAHPGHDDGEDTVGEHGDDTAEEHVDSGSTGIFGGAIVQMDGGVLAESADLHMAAAWGDIGVTGFEPLALFAFMEDGGVAIIVETFSEHAGEDGGHVLNDDNGHGES